MSAQASKNTQLGLGLDKPAVSPGSIAAMPSGHVVSPAIAQEAEAAPRCFLLTHHHHVLRSVERGAFWVGADIREANASFGLASGLLPLFFAPLPPGWVTHVCSYGPHLRPIAVEVDWRVLPHDAVPCLAGGRWTRQVLGQLDLTTVRVVAWPHEVLLSSVRAARFRSDVELHEFESMMQDFASMTTDVLALSTEPGLFASATVDELGAFTEPNGLESLMVLMRTMPEGPELAVRGLDQISQRSIDALHGALSMLAWATPRMDGWLQLLQAVLTHREHGDARTSQLASSLGVPWLASLPALLNSPIEAVFSDLSNLLFHTAAVVLIDCIPRTGLDSEQLFSRIIEATRILATKVDSSTAANELLDALDTFNRAGRAVLGMDERFRSSAFSGTVQQAIVLALLRPEPDKYRHWNSREPAIAPGAWVTGAVLVGLLTGHSRLPSDLRGSVHQQKDIAAYVANFVAHARGGAPWPQELTPSLEWHQYGAGRDAQVVLESATGPWSSRAMSLRAHWTRADLDNPVIHQAAMEMVRHFSWEHCIRSAIRVPAGQPGAIIKEAVDPTLEVKGKDYVLCSKSECTFEFPFQAEITHKLDRLSFMHELACASLDSHVLERFSTPLFRAAGSGNPALQRDIHGVQGLDYLPAYITPEEEGHLLRHIYGSKWSSDLKRKVQHYGWRYDYKARQIDEGLRLGPLPAWADHLAERLVRDGLVRQKPDQVIVNEYQPGQGISSHIDCEPCFAEDVAIISLQWAYEMEFTHARKEHVTQLLERCSLLLLRGEARYQWKHCIKPRKSDAGIPRGIRVSLTFRKVKAPS